VPTGELSHEDLEFLLYADKHRLKNHDANRYFNITFEGVITTIRRRWLNREIEDNQYSRQRLDFFTRGPCPECQGSRLNRRARLVTVAGLTIAQMGDLEIHRLSTILGEVRGQLADPIVLRARERLDALVKVGVGYLTLNRATATLSGGESQRVKMARQLGCELEGLVYILDEPTVGLHPHDIDTLLQMLRTIRDGHNTVLVVEHDPAVILAADHVIDMGPGAGRDGGEVVFSGPPDALRHGGTATSFHLRAREGVPSHKRRVAKAVFPLRKIHLHNLRNLSVDIPMGVLVCVTGVAGSGKSSLVSGYFVKQHPDSVVVDQSPIGRSRRSNPATYSGAFDPIRALFAHGQDVTAGHFSFNSAGACPECKGRGSLEIEMMFLDPVRTICPGCHGQRFNSTVLHFRHDGRNIAQVLELTVAEALHFFADHPDITRALRPLADVGLGYLTLGQELTTLSGGEAQRLKLASRLGQKGCTYVLDEPTTGLHLQDISVLMDLLHRLVEDGNSVIVIEHNLDVISEADWVIDLGPGPGEAGGQVVATGTPEEVAANPASITGRYLSEFLSPS
jgi:excinuclease UvrABC ATPase subunit